MSLFGRRRTLSAWERTRLFLAPPGGWKRGFVYLYRRTLRISATPHQVAIGVAMGAFASCTPLVGFHFLMAIGLAWMAGGNIAAAMLGTALGNPITFPFLWAASYSVGTVMLGQVIAPAPDGGSGMAAAGLTLLRALVGSVPVGAALGLTMYVPVRLLVGAYRNARRRRMRARRVATLQARNAEPQRGSALALAPSPPPSPDDRRVASPSGGGS